MVLAMVLGALLAGLVSAPPAEAAQTQSAQEAELSGREIFDRFLENRFRTALATMRITSTDPGGGAQETLLHVRWKDFRVNDQADDGVIAKTWVRFEEPWDVRHLTYLGITREDQPHDHFIYRQRSDPSQLPLVATRRVRRVRLDGVGVMGTDYTFDDIAFQSLDEASYERLPDDEIGGLPVYVVRARLKPEVATSYPTTISYIDKEHYALIRAIFYDNAGIALRELRANTETLEEFEGGIWMATQATMHHLKQGTSSILSIERLVENPALADRLFSQRTLSSSRSETLAR